MVKCVYCGEEEATTWIMNPNCDEAEPGTWDVCQDCKETIKEQHKLVFGSILMGMEDKTGFNQKHGQKITNEANKKIEEIANRTKKPILNACIYKKKDGTYDSTSVVFTGEGE